MLTCVISQPRLFPGLHYLHRMMVADVFVILDTVQFTPRHEENRAKLKTPTGPRWLTVPMLQTNREQPILHTRIDHSQPWQRKASGLLHSLYGRTSGYRIYASEIMSILQSPHETLSQLDYASWKPALQRLGISCRILYASQLPVSGRGPQLLLDICHYVGATTYLSGGHGRDYLDTAAFAASGVSVMFHEYRYPTYAQLYGDFVPFLSYLDVLFNVGLDRGTVLAAGTMCPPHPEARYDVLASARP